MSKALEEGQELQLDFEKLKKVALSDSAVLPVAVQDAETKEVMIVAYANVVVTQVIPPQGQGQSYIEANIECNTFFNAAPSPNPGGGGGPTSPISPIARLVS